MEIIALQDQSVFIESQIKLNRKPGSVVIHVTQKLSDFKRLDKNAPYRHWLQKLSRKDRLPRGKFFVGKVGGKKRLILDEFHRIHNSLSVLGHRHEFEYKEVSSA